MINISNLSRELFDQNKIAVVTCHFVTFFWALTPLVILNIMIFYFFSPLFPSIFAMAKESRLSHCDLQLLEWISTGKKYTCVNSLVTSHNCDFNLIKKFLTCIRKYSSFRTKNSKTYFLFFSNKIGQFFSDQTVTKRLPLSLNINLMAL